MSRIALLFRALVRALPLATSLSTGAAFAAGTVETMEAAEGHADRAPLEARWIPAASAGLVVFEDRVESRIDSTIGFPASGSMGTTVARLQIGLDLMSPTLGALPMSPRVVTFGGLQVSGPNEEEDVASAGDFVDRPKVEAQVREGLVPNPRMPGVFPAPETFNNGSMATSRRETLGWTFGLGLVFEIPRRPKEDPVLRLRPYVEYVGEQVEYRGKSVRVTGQPFGVPRMGDYTIHYAAASEKETYHWLGPGIDAELVLGAFEAVTFSLFGKVGFLWNLTGDSVSFADGEGLGVYHFEVDDFTIRPGGGVRLAWRGGL